MANSSFNFVGNSSVTDTSFSLHAFWCLQNSRCGLRPCIPLYGPSVPDRECAASTAADYSSVGKGLETSDRVGLPLQNLRGPLVIRALGPDANVGIITPRDYSSIGESLEEGDYAAVPKEHLAIPPAIHTIRPDAKSLIGGPRNDPSVRKSLCAADC